MLQSGDDHDCGHMRSVSRGRARASSQTRKEVAQKEDEERRIAPRARTIVAATEEPMIAPFDLTVNQSARVLGIENQDLWLGQKDCDWHLPILVTLRQLPQRSWRKRSQESEAKRTERRMVHKAKMAEKKAAKETAKGKSKGQGKTAYQQPPPPTATPSSASTDPWWWSTWSSSQSWTWADWD